MQGERTANVMDISLSMQCFPACCRSCIELQQNTFGEHNNTDLLVPSGNMPFLCFLAMHAATSVTAQEHRLRSTLSFTTNFDIVSDYEEKGTTAAWAQTSLDGTHKRCYFRGESAYIAAHSV